MTQPVPPAPQPVGPPGVQPAAQPVPAGPAPQPGAGFTPSAAAGPAQGGPAGYGPPAPAAPGGYPGAPGGYPGGYGPPVTKAAPGRLGAGLLAGGLVMVVGALVYGFLLRAMSNSDGSYHEFSYAALAVGLAVGAATGKVGGRHRVLPFAAVGFALLGVFLGELFGLALIGSHVSDGAVSVTDVLFQHFGVVWKAWTSEFDAMSALFYLIAAAEGFVVTRRTAAR